MKSVLKDAEKRMEQSFEAFENNLSTVRTGRANPAVLNRVNVDYYGSSTPLNQLANISATDPRTIVVSPFDKSIIELIEKAIRESDLGFNPNNQGENIFINVPALNDERRKALVRTTKNMAEESRISIRNVRHDIIDELKEMEKENMLTEDDLRLGKEKVQEITDSFIKKIDERLKSKEVDILEV